MFEDSSAKGFEAAICIESCLPNDLTVSDLSLVSRDTNTANFATLSFTTV